MSLERKAIRKEVVGRLYNKTAAGKNVRPNRSKPNWFEDTPAINVWFDRDELGKELSTAPRLHERKITMYIECVVDGDDESEYSDILDDLCEEIEAILSRDDSLDSLAQDIIYRDTEFEYDAEGERLSSAARMIFDVTYTVFRPRDQKRLDDLEKIVSEYEVGDAVDGADFSDEIDIPTT